MNLDIDIGNSNVKWRLLNGLSVIASGSQTTDSLSEGNIILPDISKHITRARLCSVGSNAVNTVISQQLLSSHDVSLEQACVTRFVGGVTCGYKEPSKLGADRWLAMLAAYNKHRKAVLVIDAGSAVTIDIVDDHGYHLGGYILPGTSLMAKSLRRGTKNVKVDIVDTPSLVLATTTEDAVIKGSLLSLVSTIKTVAISHPFKLVITGGSALAILKHLEMDIDFVPDLVLDGLSTPGLEFITPSG